MRLGVRKPSVSGYWPSELELYNSPRSLFLLIYDYIYTIMFCLKFPLIEKANISFRWFVNHDDDEVDENDNDADDECFSMFFQLTLFVYSVCCSFPHLWATQVCLLCRVMAQRSSRSSCKKDIVVTSAWHVLISLTPTA